MHTLLNIPWWISTLIAASIWLLPDLLHLLYSAAPQTESNPLFALTANMLRFTLTALFLLITLAILWQQFKRRWHWSKPHLWPALQFQPSKQSAAVTRTLKERAWKMEKPTASDNWRLVLLQSMAWQQLEELCRALFGELNLDARVTGDEAEQRLYMELFDRDVAHKLTAIVQCRVNSEPVEADEIKAFYMVISASQTAKGYFITTGSFTEQARKLRSIDGLTLIDGELLMQLLNALKPELSASLLKQARFGSHEPPACSTCGIKLTTHRSSSAIYRVRRCNAYSCYSTIWQPAFASHS